MKNVAYKASQGNPKLPDGFITEWFGTDEDNIDNYTIVEADSFPALLANNAVLLPNTVLVEPAPPEPPPPDTRVPEPATSPK